MITLAFPGTALESLRKQMEHPSLESAAILLCTPVSIQNDWRLLVREIHVAADDDYDDRTEISAQLKSTYGIPFERRARENNWSIVYCHTHPGQTSVRFSHIDDQAEIALSRYASERSPGVPHCALVLGRGALAARRLGSTEAVRVVEIGTNLWENVADPGQGEVRFDRQIRAFGKEGQDKVALTRVAIIGLGGTGSLMAQQLAHLGVEEFLLVDHDKIETTNLNRTVGAGEVDIGLPKVVAAKQMIERIRPVTTVRTIHGDIVDEGNARSLLEADFIFSCTDSHASRHLINQVAYQYLVPAIDMGVAISVSSEGSAHFAGHVKALVPGLSCLWCLNSLNSQDVRRELMSSEHRAADPYFTDGPSVPQPAVISINGTVASLATTMFLSMVTGLDAPARYLVYDGNRQRVASVKADATPGCNFCGPDSTFLMGDQAPLPIRRHDQS